MDRQLSYSHLPFELDRADVADRRLPAHRVVEPLDVVEYVCLGVVPRAVNLLADPKRRVDILPMEREPSKFNARFDDQPSPIYERRRLTQSLAFTGKLPADQGM